ncbi:1,4-alpha-glucan-branching enzyme 2-2, chloroplastic/amyloplastic-like [Dorcoceras hygrometricum]|uniref:1,4-alpha-glucan-branching enzyme 2-2, chloroplastic/amyloplastic-like n=1 Tax=Dorcoceras hygrometricum TaxID=472368 RepID=A0A2Z7AH84_9LAMI|nr:1,4-alpha-glucan-branching enzyme 2-2, chloroplastic/amyloplastic-like [Dorcoceras hygrometricum]
MVVDLIVIYGLKGPYCTLTTTDWFLQALSVIPRGSWGDVARRFTMIRWADLTLITAAHFSSPSAAAAARRRSSPEFRSGQFDVENPIVLISSGLLVQSDEGASSLVVDRIDESTAINREAPDLSSQAVPAVVVETSEEAGLSRQRLPRPSEIC